MPFGFLQRGQQWAGCHVAAADALGAPRLDRVGVPHPATAAATGTASAAASRLWVASACPTTWSML